MHFHHILALAATAAAVFDPDAPPAPEDGVGMMTMTSMALPPNASKLSTTTCTFLIKLVAKLALCAMFCTPATMSAKHKTRLESSIKTINSVFFFFAPCAAYAGQQGSGMGRQQTQGYEHQQRGHVLHRHL